MDNNMTFQPGAAAVPAQAPAAAPVAVAAEGKVEAIGKEQLHKLMEVLQRYKTGKVRTEQRIQASENWWKLRNSAEERQKAKTAGVDGYKSESGWLHNVITSKHADAMEAYPEPIVLPREPADRAEASILSSIIPCVMEQADFENTYNDAMWSKTKSGTGVYKVTWDAGKLNGLGDISISRCNLLNLYWEPGVTDIQKSRYFFSTELVDNEVLVENHPELEGKLKGNTFLSTRFLYDDSVTTEDKSTVIECYYHKQIGGKRTLQYVKFVGDYVISATENDPQLSNTGLYDHGLFPYVFDALFPIEGSPCGYGYVDICRDPQTSIDLLNTAFVKNAMAGAVPRYFKRADGGVNEEEFLDLTKSIVNVNGNLGEDSLRQITFSPMDDIYVAYLDRVIQELRETSGNTETATGTTSGGVTAASAIAALQEASGKGSRDSNLSSYRAYRKIINLVIELIRQFYDLPRQFRIVGQYGEQQFVTYTNQHLKPQAQGTAFGVDMGYRLPVFDIKIEAQKKNAYTTMSNNELALQFFNLGFFNPNMTDQALMCLDMMEFDSKDEMMQKIQRQGTMFQKLIQYMQLAITLAAKAAPEMVQGLSNDILQTMGGATSVPGGGTPDLSAMTKISGQNPNEKSIVTNARQQTDDIAKPKGGKVTVSAKDD